MIKPHIKHRRSTNVKRGTKFRWYDPSSAKWIDCTVTGTNQSSIRYIENHRTGHAYIGEFYMTRKDFNVYDNIVIEEL